LEALVTAYPAWTPAPRPGIVPLHPYGFGTTLGRSFTALRQNPGVLLGFALCVQALAYIVLLVAVGGVAIASFSRLETLTPGSEDYEAVVAGSVALTAVTGVVLSLATGALTVIVQGIVVSEVTSAVLAEKRTLRQLWQRVRPVAWRLIGYSALVLGAALLGLTIAVAGVVGLGFVALPAAIALGILIGLGALVLTWWLSVKLLLVPAAIIVEGARIGEAIGRSWRLTRTRFWPTFGVLIIISMTFGVIAQIVGVPLQFAAMGLGSVFAPTGADDITSVVVFLVIALATQVLTLLVQCIALIVQSTAAALVYVDARMRHEGLDLDLSSYVEQRDAGGRDLPDPYLASIGRTIAPRPAAPVGAYAGYSQAPAYAPASPTYPFASGYPQAYPQPAAYPQAPAHPSAAAYPQAPAYPQAAAPASAAAPTVAPPVGAPVAGPPATPRPAEPAPSSTSWAAPGADATSDGSGTE
jgi:hypothetical protein